MRPPINIKEQTIELVRLLKDKKTPASVIDNYGWLSDDLELLILRAGHQNSSAIVLSRAIGTAAKLPANDLKKVLVALFKNKKRFTYKIWHDITMWAVSREDTTHLISTVDAMLAENRDLFTPQYIGILFADVAAAAPGAYPTKTPEYLKYVISLLDFPNASIDSLFTSLFKEASYLKPYKSLVKLQDGKIFEAITASNHASAILDMLHTLTGDDDYLPQDIRDIFLW